jgi:uroporphyrinogen decarboxylase
MDSRERVFLALNFEEPDRVPVDFWGSPGFFRLLENRRGMGKQELLELADVDFRYIPGPAYIGPVLPPGRDIWGVPRKTVRVATPFGEETYREVISPPLADAVDSDEIDSYPSWPSADWFDYSGVKDQGESVRDRGRVAVFMGDRLNRISQLKAGMYLRGAEQILIDMLENPEMARVLLGRIAEFYAEYLTRILEKAQGAIDIILTGDDFGSQDSLLISPHLWETFLGEGFMQFNKIIEGHGAASMHHTCGYVTPLIPFFIERGLRILQSLQPEAMSGDFSAIKEAFGRKLCFHGGMSVQKTLPRGTPEQVIDDARRITDIFKPGGGFIISTAHNVQADCPLSNIDALLKAYRECCPYYERTDR